jgi:hypothetical protein
VADNRHRVEQLQIRREDTRRIRRHLDRLIEEMLNTAARRRGRDDVLSVIATVPDPERPDQPVNSL